MKIVLSGIGTVNKGAELMLYAIIQQIEHKYPLAKIYLPIEIEKKKLSYLLTKKNLRYRPFSTLINLLNKCRMQGILRRLHLPYHFLRNTWPIISVDYFIDASGFYFSDQWNLSDADVKEWDILLSSYHKQGTKIVFLPQAFGPICFSNTKQILGTLNMYADLVMARDKISCTYLRKLEFDEKKLISSTDFTSLVAGVFPLQYSHLKGGICIIPNMRMIDKGTISLEKYIEVLTSIIEVGLLRGYTTYLLNHAGKQDENLAMICRERLDKKVEVVSNLNALEVKGLIASASLCITSRFHGVASALNSCVPCLATSWSHKYSELFDDYALSDCLLDFNNIDLCIQKVTEFIDIDNNNKIRIHLEEQQPKIKEKTRQMWKYVWDLKK